MGGGRGRPFSLMTEIITVNQHHEVLPAWERCAVTCGRSPQVLTLDFHTDVLDCRKRGIELPETAATAVKLLHHDEHFDWALRKNIISRAVIIALSPCPVPPDHPMLEVRRNVSLPDMDTMLNDAENFRPLAETVLDDSFLAPLLTGDFPAGPYILDIDCDCVMCRKALSPRNSGIIRRLAQNAQLITLSAENDWVRILKLPGEEISGDFIAAELALLLGYPENAVHQK